MADAGADQRQGRRGGTASPSRAAAQESVPAAFFARVEASPEDPWLFVQHGWDWRWLAWREAAARVAAAAAALAGLPAGSRVGFRDDLSIGAVLSDLAVQTAGLIAAPIAGPLEGAALVGAVAERGCRAWLASPEEAIPALPDEVSRVAVPPAPEGGGPVAAPGAAAAAPPAPGSPGPGRGTSTPPPTPEETERAHADPGAGAAGGGGVLVAGGAGPYLVRPAELVAAATDLAGEIEAAGPGRPITVVARPLEDPLGRLQLAWATLAGAAVVLEPSPAALPATAAWARPTVLAGSAADLARHRDRLPAGRRRFRLARRRPRRPYGRLRAWIVPAAEPLSAAERAFWSERGVRLVAADLPGAGP